MKIPIILAQSEIPARVPGGGPSGAAVEPYRALARTGERISDIGGLLGHLAARKRDEELKTQTITSVGTVLTQWEHEDQALKLGRYDASGTLVEPPATAKDYVARSAAARQRSAQDALATLDDEELRARVQQKLAALENLKVAEAYTYANRLFVDEQGAEIERAEQTFIERAAMEALPEMRGAVKKEWRDFLAGRPAALTETARAKRLEDFDRKVDLYHANASIEDRSFDPATAPTDYPHLTPGDQIVLRKAYTEQTEKAERQLRENYETGKGLIYSWIVSEAQDARLTHEQWRVYQETWRFDAAQQQHMRQLLTREALGRTDPNLRRDLSRRLHQPDFAQRDLDWLRGLEVSGQLATDDYDRFASLYEQKLRLQEAEIKADERERKADRRELRADERVEAAAQREVRRDREQRAGRYLHNAERQFRIASRNVDPAIAEMGDAAFAAYETTFWRRFEAGDDPDTIDQEEFARQLAIVQPVALVMMSNIRRQLRQRGVLAERLEVLGTQDTTSLDADTYRWARRQLLYLEQIEEYFRVEQAPAVRRREAEALKAQTAQQEAQQTREAAPPRVTPGRTGTGPQLQQ